MTAFLAGVFSVATPSAVIASVVLGLIIGAFYGYMLTPTSPARFPIALWTVGLLFIVTLVLIGYYGDASVDPAASGGRAILWSFVCASIPIGRFWRRWIDLHLIRRKRGRVWNRPQTPEEREDQMFGDERRALRDDAVDVAVKQDRKRFPES